MVKASIFLVILIGCLVNCEAVIVSGVLLRAYCDFAYLVNKQGMDPVEAGKKIMATVDPVERSIFRAIARSAECASQGAAYNIVDSYNFFFLVIQIPDPWTEWIDDSCPKETRSGNTDNPGSISLKVDFNICDAVYFPSIETTNTTMVKEFLLDFQSQTAKAVDSVLEHGALPKIDNSFELPLAELSFFGN